MMSAFRSDVNIQLDIETSALLMQLECAGKEK